MIKEKLKVNYKLPHIDSLRGIAILMVILVHTSKSLYNQNPFLEILTNYGQMGVQLFFVVSAFTLTLAMKRHKTENRKIIDYFIRRVFRIAPMYYFGIALYFIFKTIKLSLQTNAVIIPEQYSIVNILANMSFIHGFYQPANNNIVPGGWSIGTEMAFYLLFPILYYVLVSLTKNTKYILKVLSFIIIITLISLSCIYWLVEFKHFSILNNSFLYYNLINQTPVFLIGILLYFLDKKVLLLQGVKNIILFVLFTTLSLLLWKTHWDYAFAFVPIISGISFVFLFSIFKQYSFMNKKLLQRIGQLSFSMYILHFIFAFEFSHQIEILLRPYLIQEIILPIIFIITVFFTFILASLTEKFIEKPGVLLGKKIIKKLENVS